MSASLHEEPLPAPSWFDGRSRDNGIVRWHYPFHLLAPGQSVLVADHGPLAKAAQRALLSYRRALYSRAGAFTMRKAVVCDIQGGIIGRNSTGQ